MHRIKYIVACIYIMITILSCATQKQLYEVPYSSNSKFKLIQGWAGKYGHVEHLNYAYDFVMPIGTPILAARSGRVIKIEEQFEDNTKTPGKENYIIIDHGDSTFSRYYHLTKNGALIDVGDKVKRGQQIGLSGNSGASAGAHLHFDITKGCFDFGCPTIPFKFANSPENPLSAGKEYQPKK